MSFFEGNESVKLIDKWVDRWIVSVSSSHVISCHNSVGWVSQRHRYLSTESVLVERRSEGYSRRWGRGRTRGGLHRWGRRETCSFIRRKPPKETKTHHRDTGRGLQTITMRRMSWPSQRIGESPRRSRRLLKALNCSSVSCSSHNESTKHTITYVRVKSVENHVREDWILYTGFWLDGEIFIYYCL